MRRMQKIWSTEHEVEKWLVNKISKSCKFWDLTDGSGVEREENVNLAELS